MNSVQTAHPNSTAFHATVSGPLLGKCVPHKTSTLVLTEADGTTSVWHRGAASRETQVCCTESWGQHKLSRSEVSVVRLIAQGMSNREIAQELYISHRTVESHVSHALVKLSMTSRVQLAGFAFQHGLSTTSPGESI